MLVLWIDGPVAIESVPSVDSLVLDLSIARVDLIRPVVVVPIVNYFAEFGLIVENAGDAATICANCCWCVACLDARKGVVENVAWNFRWMMLLPFPWVW